MKRAFSLFVALSLTLFSVSAFANRSCFPVLSSAAGVAPLEFEKPTNFDELEKVYSSLIFATKRQNRAYRVVFERPSDGKTLAVSLDFPIVTQLNNAFKDKPKTAAVFNLYKTLFFNRLKKSSVWNQIRKNREGIEFVYVDYKHIGLVFEAPTSRERQAIETEIRKIHEAVAIEFLAATRGVPELVNLAASGRSILKNPQNWVQFGFGANPMQATVTSRLARYHPTDTGTPRIRSFSESEIQEELKSKFHDAEFLRQSIVAQFETQEKKSGKKAGVIVSLNSHDAHAHTSRRVLSERGWDILRKVNAPDKASYVTEVKKAFRLEFGLSIEEPLVVALQKYYHLMDTFAPRIHERKEMSISVNDAPGGAIYVDIRGQTPRNLFRMANELALFAERGDLDSPQMMERVAHAIRAGQNSASRKFQKIRRSIKRNIRALKLDAEVHISGDEIAVLLHKRIETEDFRHYVQLLAEDRLPVRPVFLTGQRAHESGGHHVSQGEAIEKAIRQQLKEDQSTPVEKWEGLTIGVEITLKGGDSSRIRIHVAEAPGAHVAERAKVLINEWKESGALSALLPEGYTFSEVQAAVGEIQGVKSTEPESGGDRE